MQAYFVIAPSDILTSLEIKLPFDDGINDNSPLCRRMPDSGYHTDKERIAITCLPTAVRGQRLKLRSEVPGNMQFCEIFVYSGRCKLRKA